MPDGLSIVYAVLFLFACWVLASALHEAIQWKNRK